MKKLVPADSNLIPETARLAFEGQIFAAYQWPQQMFDGSSRTYEMLRRPDTVQAIVIRDNQIVLVEDEQPGSRPKVHFPGGRVDVDDESWLSAVKREVHEETGISCEDWKLVDVQQPQTKIEWFIPIFLATDITEESEQQLDKGGEKITAQWQDFDVVRNQVLSGEKQMMQYLIPFFNRVKSLEQLLNLSDFEGIEIERP